MSHLIRSFNILDLDTARDEGSVHPIINDKTLLESEKKRSLSNLSTLEKAMVQTDKLVSLPAQDKSMQKTFEDGFAEGLKSAKEESLDQGYHEGLEKGIEQGIIEGKEDAEKKLFDEHAKRLDSLTLSKKQFVNVIKTVEARIKDESSLFEPVAIELVYEVLLKIIGSRAASRDLAADILTGALEKIPDKKILKIKVSMEDYQPSFKQALNEDLGVLLEHVEIIPDPQLSPASCIIETESGNLEARLDNQLAIFKDYLVDIYQSMDTPKII